MWRDYLQMHFMIFLWGFTAILGVLISLTALEVVFYRTLIATLGTAGLLWLLQQRRKGIRIKDKDQIPYWLAERYPFLLPRNQEGKIDWKRILKFTAIGGVIGLHWLSFFGGAKVANASVCLAGIATASLWTAFIEPLFQRKAIKWYEIVLGLLVVLGLYIIFYFEFENESYMAGLGLGILAAFLAAIFSTLNSLYAKRYHHYTITMYEMLGACFTSLAGMLVLEFFFPENRLSWLPESQLDWFWLLILGGACTVYAYSVSVELLQRVSVFTMNLSINLEPLYGILLAAAIFNEHEQLTLQFYIGAGIVIAAVFLHPLFQRWEKRKRLAGSTTN